MSSPRGDEILPVLKASVHDVRQFTSLLRGVNFANRATLTVTERGLVVAVEEARTLLGTAYIFSDVFDEYQYHSESQEEDQQEEQDVYNSAFEIQLNTLIECLNIFGTAGGSGSSSGGKHVQWKQSNEEQGSSDDEDRNDGGHGAEGKRRNKKGAQGGNTSLDLFFSKSERKTSMRMTYLGNGFPLTLLIAEDSSGPTTTCEIATFEAEPQLELPFDPDDMKLKSSWLKEALSEIDPSCDKLTFIGNPPEQANAEMASGREKGRGRTRTKPILRIQATSMHGTTEMEYFNDKDVLETFECAGPGPVSFSYRFVHITRAMRALQTSIKTSLRIDKEGLLSLQFLMPVSGSKKNGGTGGGNSSNFIEFRCLALDDETS